MKQVFILAFISLIVASTTDSFSQAPQSFKYQAIARNNVDVLIANQQIKVQISIRDLTPTGTVVYQEQHTVTTNALGLFTLSVGSGTLVGSNPFSSIKWSEGNKFIEVSADLTGGNAFTSLGVSQLLSVPYALFAQNSPASYTSNIRIPIGSPNGELVPSQLYLVSNRPTDDLFIMGTSPDGSSPLKEMAIGGFGIPDGGELPINRPLERFKIYSDKTGIGTDNPTEKLDVDGNIKFSGSLMPGNLSGTAGQVLTSSGAGAAPVWADVESQWYPINTPNSWTQQTPCKCRKINGWIEFRGKFEFPSLSPSLDKFDLLPNECRPALLRELHALGDDTFDSPQTMRLLIFPDGKIRLLQSNGNSYGLYLDGIRIWGGTD
jgi:hypothetical protein